MKITYKGDYALKALLELALNYDSELLTGSAIAERIDAPAKFLEQVLLELKKGGFIESKRGKTGGYQLSRAPEKITLGEAVRFIEGDLEPISCVNEGYASCSDSAGCVFKPIWNDVYGAISAIIDNVTFEDLVSKVNKGRQAPMYSI